MKVFALFLITLAVVSAAKMYDLQFTFTNELGALADNEEYEGWVITSTGPVSTGRFPGKAQGTVVNMTVVLAAEINETNQFVLTIEPKENDDPAPSVHKFVSGTFNAAGTSVTVNTDAMWGADFASNLGGPFILATPSSADTTDDCMGIWMFDPAAADPKGINLPVAPAGFTYEGWVLNTADTNAVPTSFGTFDDPNTADSDGAGPTAGNVTTGIPPYPGSDFINPALAIDLCTDYRVIISVEPKPDLNPAAPFFLKPLYADINGTMTGTGNPQQLKADVSQIPLFTVTAYLKAAEPVAPVAEPVAPVATLAPVTTDAPSTAFSMIASIFVVLAAIAALL
mmetsp:Transcript_19407/g.21583  ORF Transcript_19407/g.21583 Transcript_19407/m.21583 type:complete len:340 (+) Transcript_19407:41-1060(+)|eukprot:CAMPEP_0168522990 /NCGR_PEP_ID=MMETSP0405-20121227/9689_1 /TAXON_ID=498012 /ORGANISM="Trichosphaerium sp, Strain Am-I-7 wt" /LENGTH=339 /DNA_ID=CAMNT_0008544723 /DNA_START=49 /DNA_END=1068 /DNA_ORIENTATION=+